MSIEASSNYIKWLFRFRETSEIDTVILDLSGKSVVEFTFEISNNGGTSIVDGQIEFKSGAPTPTSPTPVTTVLGDASVSGNVVSFANSLPYATATVVIENPPPFLSLSYSANTFPSSFNASAVVCSVGWR